MFKGWRFRVNILPLPSCAILDKSLNSLYLSFLWYTVRILVRLVALLWEWDKLITNKGLKNVFGASFQFSSVQSLSSVLLFVTPWTAALQASLCITNSLSLLNVHWVGDPIQPSHLLSSPSPPTFNFSQHQGLFKWVSSLHQVAKVLEFQLQHQSFQWMFRTDFL